MSATDHLHSCIISYNRRSLTEQTLDSYLSTVTIPHSLIIVDNGSTLDVTSWLLTLTDICSIRLLGSNMYPGYATNRGWEHMPADTTLLHRIDNDTRFLPGWCEQMVDAFTDPHVGQFGFRAAGDEQWTSMKVWPVGGNSVIRRSLYDAGLRYSEEPWGNGQAEDALLTRDVWAMGYERVFSPLPTIEYLDDGDKEYRRQSHLARKLHDYDAR